MADVFSPEKRSEIMSRIRSKNTAPEKLLFSLIKPLYKEGYRYRKHYKKIIGKPDLAFSRQKIAIFIDSEFWHGKDFEKTKKRLPKEYWLEKIENNIKRDQIVNARLDELGWTVKRIWAKEFTKDPYAYLAKIDKLLRLDE